MRIRFSNKYGSINFYGGGNEAFSITEIAGLTMPGITLNTFSYAGQEGRETLSSSKDFRTITIKGDVKGQNKDSEIRRAIKIFSIPVNMKIYVGNRVRTAVCNCTVFDPPFGKKPYKTFTLQLECDSPYFSAERETECMLYCEEDYLTYDYASYFGGEKKHITSRISRTDVINNGDVTAEPVISITNTGGVATSGEGLVIRNHTTGKQLVFDYKTEANENIVINIPERSISSSTGINLLNYLSDESYLSDFILNEGNNDIEIIPNSSEETLVALIKFNCRYLEAMN